MTENQLNNLADGVRDEGYNSSTSMKDLVFDPVTGEFKQVLKGTHSGQGEVVTEMTNKGFAAGEEQTIYVDEQDVKDFLSSKESVKCGSGHEWPGENVVHISLKEEDQVVSGHRIDCMFYGSMEALRKRENHPVLMEDYSVLCTEDGVQVFQPVCGDDFGQFKLSGPLPFQVIPSQENIFARAKGILEVGDLQDKRVMIVGLGSFGSQIAIELAKAGVGNFALMDFDRVELHNLSRHTATVNDLGRLKTDVIADAIHGKNPYAIVEKFPLDINTDLVKLYEEVGKADLVICATDNNTSRFNLSKALVEKGKVGIFGRAITRAEGGDVFRYRPGGPCYCCLIGEGNLQEEEITDVASARRDGRIAAYVSPEDADAMVQVGLSSDIEPICNLMVKLSLVELSRGAQTGIQCLEDELVYDYYIWANRRERHYGNWKPMPSAGSYPTILRWYGARIEKEEGCPICSSKVVLDSGEAIPTEDLEDIQLEL